MTEMEARQVNPLALAFIGDALFTFHVRDHLLRRYDEKAGGLHMKTKRFVSAAAQAVLFDAVAARLSQEEADVARRARNAHNNTRAKNATLLEYKKSTALEAVLGYLHLTDNQVRLRWLLAALIEAGEQIEKKEQTHE